MDATLCRFYTSPQGCFRGSSCSFRHASSGAKAEEPHPTAAAATTTDPEAAALAAAVDSIVISASNPYANVSAAASGARTCRFFASPLGCRNGPQCQFAHVAPMPARQQFAMGEQQAIEYANAMYYQPPQQQPGAPLPPVMPPMMLSDPPPPPLPGGVRVQIPSPHGMRNSGGSSPSVGSDGFSSVSAASNGAPRRALKIQANPSKTGNYEVISEVLPVLTREIEGPVRLSISGPTTTTLELLQANG